MMFLRIPEPETWRRLGPLDFARAPVGTGPFVLERWRDGRVSLSAHRGSWRAPKVDRVEIVMIPDQAARVQALTSGAVDIAIGLTPEEEPAIAAAGARLHIHLKPETSFLAFVSTKPGEVKDVPVKDIRVRRALNYAVNKQAIIDTILGGATAPASQISHPQAFGYNPDLAPYPYDPAKAKALLAEAGFPDGFDLPILLVGGFNNFDSIYQLIGIDLAAVGVRLKILRNTPAKQQEYVYQGGWPTLGFAMTSSMFDPLGGYRIRSCAWPHPYHCDPAIMPLIDAAQVAPTPELRAELTRKVMAAEHDNPPGIILWQSPGFDGVSHRVSGYKASEDFIPFHDLALEPNE
jgi:peptide/nickel transport system substrate-binding protein